MDRSGAILCGSVSAGVALSRLAKAERGKALRRLAQWIWSGGGEWCQRCKLTDAPCAKGRKDEEGRRCPQISLAPQTLAGVKAWDLAQDGGVWRQEWFSRSLEDGSEQREFRPIGLIMAEIRERHCAPLDDDLIFYLRQIERGARLGAAKGWGDEDSER